MKLAPARVTPRVVEYVGLVRRLAEHRKAGTLTSDVEKDLDRKIALAWLRLNPTERFQADAAL